MLKVLLVDDTLDRASAVLESLSALEHVTVASTSTAAVEFARRVAELEPDIVLIASSSRDVLERLGEIPPAARPVVLFTEDAHGRLREELSEVKLRLAERKDVERAKGILMRQRALDEDAAFAALRSLAMQRGIRLGEAARQVIDVAGLLG